MERSAWTDERLDDVVARHERQFELLRAEMRDGFRELRDGLSKLHSDMLSLTTRMIAAFAALFATLFAALIAQAI
jgi:hypothetical protein